MDLRLGQKTRRQTQKKAGTGMGAAARLRFGWCALPLALLAAAAPAQDDPAARAAATERQMTDDERITLTLGHLTSNVPGRPTPPPGARPGAGFIPGIPRLGIPALYETDA